MSAVPYECSPVETLRVAGIEGDLPKELDGALIRNGGGIFEVGGEPLAYFDSTALVASLRISKGEASIRAEFVRTPVYEAEKGGHLAHRRAFSNLPGGWFRNMFKISFAPLAAHDIYAWGGELFAAGFPDEAHWALDATTLATRGPRRFAQKGHLQSPMPVEDPATGQLITYGLAPGMIGSDVLTFYAVDAEWKVVRQAFVKLGRQFTQVHSHAFTPRYGVAILNPQTVDVFGALMGRKPIIETLRHTGAPLQLLLVPWDGSPPITANVSGANVFHIVNAYEDGGNVVVDACIARQPVDFAGAFPKPFVERQTRTLEPYSHTDVMRIVVDPSGKATTKPLTMESLELPLVNPAFRGRAYRYAWGAARDPSNPTPKVDESFWPRSTLKLDTATGATTRWFEPETYASQPAFAPRPGATAEDDGWLLVWTAHTSTGEAAVVVLDAATMKRVATIRLEGKLPAVSHNRFVPA